jgi:predicted unusual protein kinase regulating ubiquinone biosynthesis (AarF/ABC1/UbiB family)
VSEFHSDTPRSSLPPLVLSHSEKEPPQFRAFSPPSPPLLLVARRTASMSRSVARFACAVMWDRLWGKDSPQRRAERARLAIIRQGGVAIRAARQLAMRLDTVELETASELARLQDVSPPILLSVALERVEQAVGQSIEVVFEQFDPEPILSNSLMCVYQAKLRAAAQPEGSASEGWVAVRVRRPDAALKLNTERVALSWLFTMLRTLLRDDRVLSLHHLQKELPQMMLEGLDFRRSMRLMRMFNDAVADLKIKQWAAAAVYVELCSDDVIINEFVSGIRLREVIAVQESGSMALHQELVSRGLDPEDIGRQILRMGWWSFFENYFFCELVDLHNIVIRADGVLVLTDIAEVGVVGPREQRMLKCIYRHLCQHDVSGAVGIILQLLAPLPHINIYEFSKRLEARLWGRLLAMDNRDSEWWERTSMGLWVELFEVTREFGVPVRLDISRIIQSISSNEYVAAQVWPELRILKEFKRYERRADRRGARRTEKEWIKRRDGRPRGDVLAAMAEGADTLERVGMWLESTIDSAPLTYLKFTRKSAYSAATVLSCLMFLVRFTVVVMLGVGLWRWVQGSPVLPRDVAVEVLQNPVYLLVILATTMLSIRRILIRLEDIDRDG